MYTTLYVVSLYVYYTKGAYWPRILFFYQLFISVSMETYSYFCLCDTKFNYVHYMLVCEVYNPLSMFLGSFTTYGELCLVYCELVYLDPYTACVYL